MKRISIIVGCMVLLVVGILVFANQSQEQILVEEGTKNENTSLVFMLQKEDGTYSKSDSLPSSGYSFNATKSVCSNGATSTWEDNRLYLNNLTSNGTSCYLYFDMKPLAMNTILANSTVHEGTPDFSQVATTDEGIYKAEDDLGTSYYFRGAVENNYLKFAGYWWRIIRINGDGSIRMIYDGTSAHANGESSTDRQTGTSAFNDLNYNYSYGVGYTYQVDAQRPSSQNGGTASTIKGVLDNWYATNILGKGLDDKIVSSPGFCNDRNTASGSSWVSSGTTFYYAAYERLYTNKTPTLECSNSLDLYITKIGLITADEIVFAGGLYGFRNSTFYLNNGESYWTMTPHNFSMGTYGDQGYANAFYLWWGSQLSTADGPVDNSGGVRPVINLSADVSLTGIGTMSDPYVVEGAE